MMNLLTEQRGVMSRNTFTLALVLSLVACGKHEPKGTSAAETKASTASPPMKVEVSVIESQRMPKYMTLTGSILADRQSEVAANVSGRVAATYAERGQP